LVRLDGGVHLGFDLTHEKREGLEVWSLSPAVELPTDSLGSDEWVSCSPPLL